MSVATHSLLDLVHSRIVSDESVVPVFDPIALRVQQVVADPDFELEDLEKLLLEDAGLVSALLRVANSAFYRGLEKVKTVRDAVTRLGASQVASVISAVTQRSHFQASDPLIHTLMQALWRHAFACSLGASWIATRSGYADQRDEAFLAGLLHDVGKVFLLKIIDEVKASDDGSISLSEPVIRELLDQLHCEQGYLLMKRWDVPEVYQEIARDHHLPFEGESSLLAAVRLADLACHKLGVGLTHEPTIVLAATPEAHALRASEVMLAELEVMLEDASTLAKML